MSTNDNYDNDEAAADVEKAQCRRNRRTSIQFIDKNLIRRRSSGNEKPGSAQPPRLFSIDANCERESSDLDHLQQYSENLLLKIFSFYDYAN